MRASAAQRATGSTGEQRRDPTSGNGEADSPSSVDPLRTTHLGLVVRVAGGGSRCPIFSPGSAPGTYQCPPPVAALSRMGLL